MLSRILDSLVIPLLSRVYVLATLARGLAHRAVSTVLEAPTPPAPVPTDARMRPPPLPARRVGMLPYMTLVMPLLVDPVGAPMATVYRAVTGQLYLAVLVDGDDEADRWIYASITGLEHAAIVGALVDTREVLTRADVYVVDRAPGYDQALRIWMLPGAALPTTYLPAVGSRFAAEDIAAALDTSPRIGDSGACGVTS